MAKFSCLFLAPDELPALIRTAEGAWGDQQGYQVGEDHKNLKMGDAFTLKHKVQPKSPGNTRTSFQAVLGLQVGALESKGKS